MVPPHRGMVSPVVVTPGATPAAKPHYVKPRLHDTTCCTTGKYNRFYNLFYKRLCRAARADTALLTQVTPVALQIRLAQGLPVSHRRLSRKEAVQLSHRRSVYLRFCCLALIA